MKRAQAKAPVRAIALALTWDGARWPGKLPPKARAFLAGKSKSLSTPTTKELSRLFSTDEIREMRICWVPRLKGGREVLSEPLTVPGRKRLGFAAIKMIRLGDSLGVIYRRKAAG